MKDGPPLAAPPKNRETLDALSQRVIERRAEFDFQLHRNKHRFPIDEFDRFWRAFLDYCAGMGGSDWLHRNVIREVDGLRRQLEMGTFKTPSDALQKAENMKRILFDGYDPHGGVVSQDVVLTPATKEGGSSTAVPRAGIGDTDVDLFSSAWCLVSALTHSVGRRATEWRSRVRAKFWSPREEAAPTVDPELIERVKQEKSRRRDMLMKYRDRPRLSFVVHSFNRIANIDQLVAGLRHMGAHELIVCEDGSLDGSRERWLSHLDQPNDFLVHSNDIHEIRVTDRGIRFAAAEIVCLVQDDDYIPRDTGWLDAALAHFDTYPNLAIVGGFMGFPCFDHLLANPPDPNMPKLLWGPAPFQFVHYTNVGPYFIRKNHYEALGGWDFSFSLPGEPGIGFECELCLRAWLNGYQVGYSFVPFKGPPGHYALDGGTMLFASETRLSNQERNLHKLYEMYKDRRPRIDRRVRAANRRRRVVDDRQVGTRGEF